MLIAAITSGYLDKVIQFGLLLTGGSGIGWLASVKLSNLKLKADTAKTQADTSAAAAEALKTKAESQDISSITAERLIKLSDDRVERIDKDNQLLREQFNLLEKKFQRIEEELTAKKLDAAIDKRRIEALEGHVIVLENVVRSLGGEIPPRPQHLLRPEHPPYSM